jgi:Flp pilus assembly protein TadG
MKQLQHLSSRRAQRGAVAIIVGLTMAVLVGFAGLALDGGRLYVNKTELQNAADACALAASYELTGAPDIPAANFTQAHNAGMLVATRNRVGFQAGTIDGQDVTIQFGTSLAGGAWLPAASNPSATSVYVRCTLQETGITPWFMQVLGFGDQTVAALATATLAHSETNCIAIPLAMCSAGPAPTYGLNPGQWYNGGFSNDENLTGSFNWVDFSPPSGGASELRDLLLGSGACTVSVGSQVGNPGAIQSIRRAWNTRFGVYHPSINPATAVPDRSGYAYRPLNWPSQANALADFLPARRTVNAPYGNPDAQAGNTITGLAVQNNSTVLQANALAATGADRRLVVAPIVDCAGLVGSQTVPILDWACVFMLHPMDNDPALTIYMEFAGLTSNPATPCAAVGGVGSSASTGPRVPALVQ